MTANEMWMQFLIEYEKINSNRAPGIVDFGPGNEASIILSRAQRTYVQMFMSAKANATVEGFDETELRKQGLSELIKDGTNLTQLSANQTGVLDSNSTFWDLPLDFMYTILESVEIDKNDCRTNSPAVLPVRVVSHNEYNKLFYNPYRKPFFDGSRGLVWRIQYSREINNPVPSATVNQTNKRHELITDGTFNITSYRVRYLKNPDDIIVDVQTPANQVHCKLDDRTHDIIINIAVNQLSEYLREQRPKSIVENYTIE